MRHKKCYRPPAGGLKKVIAFPTCRDYRKNKGNDIMGTQSRRDYLRAIKVRYKQAPKKEKKEILDEFCKVRGYHRKHAIRLLNQRDTGNCHSKRRKRAGRKKEYTDPLLLDYLPIVWKLMNLPCSKRLAAALPLWVPHLKTTEEKQLPEKIQSQLMKISASTIDRLMYPPSGQDKETGFFYH